MGRKSYNPFKMWGAWILIILMVLWIIPSAMLWFKDCGGDITCKTKLNNIINFPDNAPVMDKMIYFPLYIHGIIGNATNNTLIAIILTPLILIIAGFLLGYAIHSIVRASRK